jgi:hypothetical protein
MRAVPPATNELSKELEFELQEIDHDRELDSLETVVVRSLLAARGFAVPDQLLPPSNTIQGWLTWAERSSQGG